MRLQSAMAARLKRKAPGNPGAVQEFMRYADERYVAKDYLKTVTDRLERIEEKIDALASDRARERGQAAGVSR